ncbi:hypothetical protein [Pseudomonas syringae]|uniref:hypothetical protein n=1 Tax=Pseudomonas syringae TaxID=317 RepID=UPI001011C7A9|nr:hypothetical protein [Pseudomonas syringae]RXT62619.1 hypothetical protein B1F71_23885 [Pseudomonas syringae]RXT98109.1 hypothetical protein B1F75_01540 [Pseudomonas syringae]
MFDFKKLLKMRKKIWAFILTLVPAIGFGLTHLDEMKKAYGMLQSPDAQVTLETESSSLNVGDTRDLVIKIYPTADHKLPLGTITLVSSSEALKVTPTTDAEVPEFAGSVLLKQFKVRAISFTDTPISVSATYRTGDLKKASNPLVFKISPKPQVLKPHFERTDTKRVILTGEWEMVLGASPGVLKLVQAESKLTGSFQLPRYKWQGGKISGSKDGNTFRMQFSIPFKSVEERLWVVGDYAIEKETGSIQMRGCAYHLRHAPTQMREAGAQGIDCSTTVKFSTWKTLQADTFMATASFDFGSDY